MGISNLVSAPGKKANPACCRGQFGVWAGEDGGGKPFAEAISSQSAIGLMSSCVPARKGGAD